MERLTKRIKTPQGESIADFSNKAVHKFVRNHEKGIKALFDKLAEYEDTGLTPEKIRQIDKDFTVQAKELGKLKKKLPTCEIGNIVYVIAECEMISKQLDGTLYSSNGEPGTATGYYCPYEDSCPFDEEEFECCEKYKNKPAVFEDTVSAIIITSHGTVIETENCAVVSQIGEYIFLSQEEAEAKLEEMENE